MRFTLFTLMFLFSLPTSALSSECFSESPIFDRTEIWNFQSSARTDFYLPTINDWGFYKTPAAAHILWNGLLHVNFDYVSSGFSRGYTVDRMLIEIGGRNDKERVEIDLDYTYGCSQSGPTIYPGKELVELPIKIPPRSDGFPRGNEPVRIRFWGLL